MITDIEIYMFQCPVTVAPGDSLRVYCRGREVIRHPAAFEATWTCSVTFKLDGETQWMIGNDKTIEWLKGLACQS